MTDRPGKNTYDLWTRLRFAVIGRVLANPPDKGALKAEIAALAAQEWRHPVTGEMVRFGRSTIKLAFTRTEQRTQRKSDGAITIDGRRCEAPNQYRHLTRLHVRYAAWDLTRVHLVDDRLNKVLCRLFPQDKARNADGLRRSLTPISAGPTPPPASGMAPLLKDLIDVCMSPHGSSSSVAGSPTWPPKAASP